MDLFQILVTIISGGVATTLAVQLLKSSLIPFIKAETYPRITTAVVSVIATVVAFVQNGVTLDYVLSAPEVAVAMIGGILLVAANTYNNVLKHKDDQPALPADVTPLDEEPVHATSEDVLDAVVSEGVAPADEGETYTVQPGDTLPKIAGKLGVSIESLAEANDLAPNSIIHPDQVLIIQR